MKISVVIPAYNAAGTISETLDSVMRQTLPAHEILVMDDGSKDETAEIVSRHPAGVNLLRQNNSGVAVARNELCRQAKGDLVAFLDADDLWHPRYLETQQKLYRNHPNGVAFFTGHFDLFEGSTYSWKEIAADAELPIDIWEPLPFLRSYDLAPGRFACLSHCCVPKDVIQKLGPEPFRLRLGEDLFFVRRLLLISPGQIVYSPLPLLAYKLRTGSHSYNRLVLNKAELDAFAALSEEYYSMASRESLRVFGHGFNMKRRLYAKTLMGAGNISEARQHLRASLGWPFNPVSFAKSLGLLVASYLPKRLQPNWPPVYRDVHGAV